MDKKQELGRRKSARSCKWSPVDTVLIVLIVAALVGGVWRFVDANRHTAKETGRAMYEVYFEVVDTHEAVLDSIDGFDDVYLMENDAYIGKIPVYQDAQTGEYYPAITPVVGDVTEGEGCVVATGCLMAADVRETARGLLIGETGLYLTPGMCLEVRTDRAKLTLRVTEIVPHS